MNNWEKAIIIGIISRILNISPACIWIIAIDKDELGISVLFKNSADNKKYVIELTKNFRLLSYYPL